MKDEMGGAYGTYIKDEKLIQNFSHKISRDRTVWES
jgi:hypothetical protein